ncbi:MAG: tetratricopeptide repeat protein [Treponema sp.]|jgi:tetratricopeptide (TPR) repeat protein|nr:tetratricopeptide repeat protein [Treponema sp.]
MDIQTFFSQLDQVYNAGDLKAIESFLQMSLEEARRENGGAEVSVLNELMGFYRNTGRIAEALLYTEQALLKTRALDLVKSAGWGTTLLNAATAFQAAGNKERARELYREAEQVYRELLPQGDPLFSALYNNMSGLYAEDGDLAAAAELLLRALEITAGLDGMEIEQAIMRVNLGGMYTNLGKDTEALAEITAALSIYDEQAGPDGKKDPHYAAALAALAAHRQREGRRQEAAALYEQALEEIQMHYGKNRHYYLTCRNLARVYLAIGEQEQSARYFAIAGDEPPRDGGGP